MVIVIVDGGGADGWRLQKTRTRGPGETELGLNASAVYRPARMTRPYNSAAAAAVAACGRTRAGQHTHTQTHEGGTIVVGPPSPCPTRIARTHTTGHRSHGRRRREAEK